MTIFASNNGAVLLIALYLFPTIVALCRSHNVGGVLVINVLLGWTIIGWIGAMFMACGYHGKQAA